MKMSKFQVTVVAILATLTVAVLCGIGFVVYNTMTRSYGDPMSQPVAHQPVATPQPAVPTATPIPTWTPKPLPASTPTPDVKAEVEAYLDELDPLLDDMEEMWWEWHDWYHSLNGGKGMTSSWCLSYGHTLDTRFRELEIKHLEIVADMANLTPPRQLKHAHDKLVSAYRHKKEYHFLNFRACAGHRFQLWETAGIESNQGSVERQAAFDEIREVLNKLGIEWEDREEQEEDLEREA